LFNPAVTGAAGEYEIDSGWNVPTDAFSSISLTTKNGAIVGWNMSASYVPNCYCEEVFSSSSSSGDAFFQALALSPDSEETGSSFSWSAAGSHGSWSVSEAPEIDPSSAAGSLALLVSGLFIVRGRRLPALDA
jgi:hypothetical protein